MLHDTISFQILEMTSTRDDTNRYGHMKRIIGLGLLLHVLLYIRCILHWYILLYLPTCICVYAPRITDYGSKPPVRY